jgi:hypothetical protein
MDVSSNWIWSLHVEQLIVLWGFHGQSCFALQFMHKISTSSCHICLQFKNHGIVPINEPGSGVVLLAIQSNNFYLKF